MTALRALLAGVVDFAGTYPPASLPAEDAVAEYSSALASPHSWLLGRLVWPASRLDELGALAAARDSLPWRVSAVVGTDIEADFAGLAGFGRSSDRAVVVDMAEVKAVSEDDVARLRRLASRDLTLYVEVPASAAAHPLLPLLKEAGWCAKMRTGGVTAESFPAVSDVLQLIASCVELDLPLKATAGLHHAVRGEYPLTYEPGCPRGTMFGFLNLLVAVALLESGDAVAAARAMEERDPHRFHLEGANPRYGDRAIGETMPAARRRLHSFGSCSFREPVADLISLGVLA